VPRVRESVRTLLVVAALLVGTEVVLRALTVPTYIFPTPSEVWFALRMQSHTATIAWLVTVGEAMAGLFIAIMLSSLLASATICLPRAASKIVNSIGIGLQSTPLLAIAPLLSLWFGQSFTSKALASCIVCFFPLLTGWLSGVRSVDVDQLQLFENLKASKLQTARFLLVPSALPFFFSGLRVAMPLALLGAIVAEFVGASSGIGFQILQNSYYVRTPAMFAYVVIAALTGFALTSLVSVVERRILFWHGAMRQ
jgi:ABC-type nitrate/sulfonate/bicarbonate transport system permease component